MTPSESNRGCSNCTTYHRCLILQTVATMFLNFHPPTQEATALQLWRNAQRVSSDPSARAYGRRAEALAKGTGFGGFRRRHKMDHGCKAVGLHMNFENRCAPV